MGVRAIATGLIAGFLLLAGEARSHEVQTLDLRQDKTAVEDPHYVVLAARDDTAAGHAFVVWGKEDSAKGQSTQEAFGFYPKEGKGAFGDVPGKIQDELDPRDGKGVHQASHRIIVRVNKEQWERAYALRDKWKTENYDLWDQNCINFLMDVARELGIDPPAKGGAQRPPSYLEDLMKAVEAKGTGKDDAARPRDPNDARLAALLAQKYAILKEMETEPSIPPSERKQELRKQLVPIREEIRRLRAAGTGRSDRTGPKRPPPRGDGTGGEPRASSPLQLLGGAEQGMTAGMIRDLAVSLAEKVGEEVAEKLASALRELLDKRKILEPLLQKWTNEFRYNLGNPILTEAEREAIRARYREITFEVDQLEEAIEHKGAAQKVLKREVERFTTAVGTMFIVSDLLEAEKEGKRLIAAGEHEEAWRVYVGTALRTVVDTLTTLTKKIPGGFVVHIALSEAAERLGREVADATLAPFNRIAHWLYQRDWWPKERVPRIPLEPDTTGIRGDCW